MIFMQESLLFDHARHPRCKRDVLSVPYFGHAANPLCADAFDVGVLIEDDKIILAEFSGSGCALATGSASLLCETLRGMRVDEIPSGLFHLPNVHIGRMREGCVTVSLIALRRALDAYASR